MRRLITLLEWLVREAKLKAQYWTALGAMAIPLGISLVALAVVFHDYQTLLMTLGIISALLGFVFSVAGWIYIIRG